MRIAFWTLPAEGHMNPMMALARKVRERGHDVYFIGIPDCEERIRAGGFEFHTFAAEHHPLGYRKEVETALSKMHGMAGVKYLLERMKQGLDVVLEEVPPVLRDSRAEAIVADYIAGGSFLVAARLKLPIIHVANALAIYQYKAVPLALYPWGYREGAIGRLRNSVGYWAFRMTLRPYWKKLTAHAERLGVPFNPGDPNDIYSKLAQITQVPREFDFPNPELPSYFHHTGPFHDGTRRPPCEFPWERLTGEPLIYASMGTIQNGHEQVFQKIAEACAGSGRQLVMSYGPNITPESIGSLPDNCIAVSQAPQLELLKRATLSITHAGLNTALESLAAGVPMVAIPVTNDQPGVAARIDYTGTGVVVPFKKLTTPLLKQAVDRVMSEERFGQNARRLQAAIAEARGLANAASIVDGCLARGV